MYSHPLFFPTFYVLQPDIEMDLIGIFAFDLHSMSNILCCKHPFCLQDGNKRGFLIDVTEEMYDSMMCGVV